MNWELLESDEDLADMLKDAAGRTAVAVDTEFMRRNTFYPEVALVQLCFVMLSCFGTWLSVL